MPPGRYTPPLGRYTPWAGTPSPLGSYTPRQVRPSGRYNPGRYAPLAGTPPVHSCLHCFHVTCCNMYFICRARMTPTVSAHTPPHSKVPGLSPTNDCTCTSTWIKNLSCNADHQEVRRCHTRGESEEFPCRQ